MSQVCRTLGVSRSTAYRPSRPRPRFYRRREDEGVLAQVRSVVRERATYGHRRVTVVVNRRYGTGYNRKRIRRVMRIHGLQLPPKGRRRNGRPHRGRVEAEASDRRWCSDLFRVPCWNGETVHVAFVLDAHDREVPAWVGRDRDLRGEDIEALASGAVAARFPGEARAPEPVEFLSDNGSQYTALPTVIGLERLGLIPRTTPVGSPESNGMAEAFVRTLKRDYVETGDLSSAAAVLEQLPGWFEDYNEVAPHSALGMKSPAQYRAERSLS